MSPSKRRNRVTFLSGDAPEERPAGVEYIEDLELAIGPNQRMERIDVFLARQIGFVSRSRIQGLIEEGQITVDERAVSRPSEKVQPGQVVRLSIPRMPKPVVRAETIPLDILHEDEHLLVIDKDAEMVIHPARGCYTGTLVNALMAYLEDLPEEADEQFRPGIVHRLDRGTTGLMVVGKTPEATRGLSKMFHDRTIHRLYRAIVWTRPRSLAGTIDAEIGRDLRDRLRMAIVHEGRGRRAVTHYRTAASYDFLSLLELKLETGRTHQIRLHMEALGHPVFGDPVYSGRDEKRAGFVGDRVPRAKRYLAGLDRQALHSWRMGFVHPVTQKRMEFEAPLPQDMQAIIDSECKEGGRQPAALTGSVFDWRIPD